MPKYCMVCKNEFRDDIKTCPTDGVALSKHPIKEKKDELLIDIYVASNEIEAERIESLLKSLGIKVFISNQNISQLPVTNQTSHIVSVNRTDKEKALKTLKEAQDDGIISLTGIFL